MVFECLGHYLIKYKVVDTMSNSYSEKFNVLEVFEQNPYQKIIMGTKKDSPDDVVVINVFNKGDHLNSKFVSDLFSSLQSLAFFEETDTELTIATNYNEGMSLSNYIESTELSDANRKALATEYLKRLKNYDSFDPYFLSLFAEDKQLILNEGDFVFNELLIFDDALEQTQTFDRVVHKVSDTLEKILLNPSIAGNSGLTGGSVPAFIGELRNTPSTYASLSLLSDGLKKALLDPPAEPEEVKEEVVTPLVAPIVTDVPKTPKAPQVPAEEATETRVEATPEVASKPLEEEVEDVIEEVPASVSPEEIPVKREESEIELEDVTYTDSDLDEIFSEQEKESKRKRSMWLFFIALVIIIGFFAKFVFFKDSKLPPVASFERIEQDDKIVFTNTSTAYGDNNSIKVAQWTVESGGKEFYNSTENYNIELILKNDGTYKVTLRVQDANEKWREPYFQEFDYTVPTLGTIDEGLNPDGDAEVNEKLNKYTITLEDNGSYDSEVKRSGSKAIKLDLAANGGKGKVTLEDIFIDNNYIISMWMMTDDTAPVKIQFTGYNNGSVKFVKSVTHNPTAMNLWEMVEASGGSNLIDKLEIVVSSDNATVWLDDIELSSYK